MPSEQAERFIAKLEAMTAAHGLVLRPGDGHGGWSGADRDPSLFAPFDIRFRR